MFCSHAGDMYIYISIPYLEILTAGEAAKEREWGRGATAVSLNIPRQYNAFGMFVLRQSLCERGVPVVLGVIFLHIFTLHVLREPLRSRTIVPLKMEILTRPFLKPKQWA